MTGFFSATFRAEDADQVEQHLRSRYGRLALTGAGTTYTDATVGDTAFSLSHIRFDGGFACDWTSEWVTLASATEDYRWEVGDARGTGADGPVLFQPGTRVSAQVEQASAVAVNLDVAALTETARTVYADDTVRIAFDSPRPRTREAGWSWKRMVQALVADMGMLENDLLRRSASRYLAVMTLESFQLSGDPAERAVSAESQAAAYRLATRFLSDNASLPITVDDAAQAAGVSTLNLVRAFRAHSPSDFTPAAYLRRTRLEAAHHDLVAADPTLGATVTEIARRWGFAHPGRFAQLHRATYGVSPKLVLDS